MTVYVVTMHRFMQEITDCDYKTEIIMVTTDAKKACKAIHNYKIPSHLNRALHKGNGTYLYYTTPLWYDYTDEIWFTIERKEVV